MKEQKNVPFLLVIRDGNPYRTRSIKAFKAALALFGYDYSLFHENGSYHIEAKVNPQDCDDLYRSYFAFGGV